jgi:hypothetical protein
MLVILSHSKVLFTTLLLAFTHPFTQDILVLIGFLQQKKVQLVQRVTQDPLEE